MRTERGSGPQRRGLLGTLAAAAVTAVAAPMVGEAVAAGESRAEKRKARYQANSPDVQAFYRVNRYPKPAAKGE